MLSNDDNLGDTYKFYLPCDPSQFNDLEIFVAYEKPWDEDFQDVPGTPGRGDQFSLGGSYSW